MLDERVAKLNEGILAYIPSTYEKRTYTVEEIQSILNIGRNASYTLIKSNQFHAVRVGGSIRISKKSFDAWLDAVSENDGTEVTVNE